MTSSSGCSAKAEIGSGVPQFVTGIGGHGVIGHAVLRRLDSAIEVMLGCDVHQRHLKRFIGMMVVVMGMGAEPTDRIIVDNHAITSIIQIDVMHDAFGPDAGWPFNCVIQAGNRFNQIAISAFAPQIMVEGIHDRRW